MKIAPVIHEIEKAIRSGHNLSYRLVHTGQHYDKKLSGTFFIELNIPEPDINIGAGSGTQAEQTAAIMTGFERELIKHPSDLVIVVGDVTSTMACSITAKKLNIKVAHIEAGIRSFDLSMPEEINRMVTDSITDYFFTTSEVANSNLRKSGVADDNIFFVGNVMIDTLLANRSKFRQPALWDQLHLEDKKYIVVTLHRPVNVDEPENLKMLLDSIVSSSEGLPVIFPVHPRTLKVLQSLLHKVTEGKAYRPAVLQPQNHLSPDLPIAPSPTRPLAPSPFRSVAPSLHLTEPLGYLEFNYLVERALAVITDSGGITEETTVMGVPCLTLRDSTERPETCTIGTNELIGTDPRKIKPAMRKLFEGKWKKGGIPPLWDGRAAERIVKILLRLLTK
jgi:UDP-N-acetylglucosamine 2-epimerase (non-hydrolysing)